MTCGVAVRWEAGNSIQAVGGRGSSQRELFEVLVLTNRPNPTLPHYFSASLSIPKDNEIDIIGPPVDGRSLIDIDGGLNPPPHPLP